MLIKNKGFSLVELMIVVGIIAMLTLMAYPFYQDYVIRAHVTQAISETINYKTDMYETYMNEGEEGLTKYIKMVSESGWGWQGSLSFNGKSVRLVEFWKQYDVSSGELESFGYTISLHRKIFPKEVQHSKQEIGVKFLVNGIYFKSNDDTFIEYPVTKEEPPHIFCGQVRNGGKNFYQSVRKRTWHPQGCRDAGTSYNGNAVRDGATDFDTYY